MMDPQKLIFFLCSVIISSAADPETLNASVGGNITLPDAVEEEGFLLYGGNNIALVDERKLLKIYEENYQKRLHWNQNTGRFTLTGLQKSDSGNYTVDSKTGRRVFVHYKLTVYDSAPTPNVMVLSRSSESCSLSCSVDSAQENVTLLWTKDLQILKKSDSAASLSLTLFDQDLNSTLQCVAENPAEKKTVSVDVKRICKLNQRVNTSGSTDSKRHLIVIGISILCGVLLLLFLSVAVGIWRFCHPNGSSAELTEVQFITINKFSQREEPSEPADPTLTTVRYEPVFNDTLSRTCVTSCCSR
ncbi:unnamed protein product [Ophioblennius macclurei]